MNRSLLIIFATVGLDAIGIGLIFPILPRLLQEVTHTAHIATYIGIMTALYALMQFIFSPLLGSLSDNWGRRPVLILSLAGAAINYFIMAFSPHLWMLILGRAIAGLTSANASVAAAYITDVSPEDTRARRFGLLNAVFGAGFIIGPVMGGILSDYWLRLPFMVAALLNAANLLLTWKILPESRCSQNRPSISLTVLNPLQPLRWIFTMKSLLPIVCLFCLMSAAGEAYGTCWTLWGFDTFHWNGLWVGMSLGAFGICQTLVQAFLPGIVSKWLGEQGAVLSGIACSAIALVIMAYAKEGWMVFAIMPVFALTGIGTPALQALASRQVAPDRQGEFQGVLTSAISLASIIAPLGFSTLYFSVQNTWPGAIWLTVVCLYVFALPLLMKVSGRKTSSKESLT
ncbi:TCR/Tet family MFS transporter [uncultured Tolumonas sp.]|uniref:TCR/Tet family MFS transporter n=1 Tax=uncultured Tolumonas sp. TaxID=263765 RepID=UPI002931B235|nr:TCR/Tet family MFS transporter [uncultured Tolumonas sp.]